MRGTLPAAPTAASGTPLPLATGPRATAQLVLRFPDHPAGLRRGPRFVSPCASQSVGVTAVPSGSSGTEQYYPMPTSSLLVVPVPIGTDTIRVATYGNAGSSCAPSPQAVPTGSPAALLSVGTTTATIAADQNNVVTMVLQPFVASVGLTSSGSSSLYVLTRQTAAPTATTYPVTAIAYDAAGDPVKAPFANQVGITASGSSHFSPLPAATTLPDSNTTYALSWDQYGDTPGTINAYPAALPTPAGVPTIAPALQPTPGGRFSLVPDYDVVVAYGQSGSSSITVFSGASPVPTQTAVPPVNIYGLDAAGPARGCPSGSTVVIGGDASGSSSLAGARIVNHALSGITSVAVGSDTPSQVTIAASCVGMFGSQAGPRVMQVSLAPSIGASATTSTDLTLACAGYSTPAPNAPSRVGGFAVDPASGTLWVDGYANNGFSESLYSSYGATCSPLPSGADGPMALYGTSAIYDNGGVLTGYDKTLTTTGSSSGFSNYAYALRVSGSTIAISKPGGGVAIVDAPTFGTLVTIANSYSADFSPDGTYLWSVDTSVTPFAAKRYAVADLRAGNVNALATVPLPGYTGLGAIYYDHLRTTP